MIVMSINLASLRMHNLAPLNKKTSSIWNGLGGCHEHASKVSLKSSSLGYNSLIIPNLRILESREERRRFLIDNASTPLFKMLNLW